MRRGRRTRQEEPLDGNKGLAPVEAERKGRLGSKSLRLQYSSKRRAARPMGSPRSKILTEEVLSFT